MLRVLEPIDLRAAVAVALGFFGAMRPIEIRGLMWSDYDGTELHIQRGYFKGDVPLKTKGSNRRIKVIEPLRSLLNKLPRSGGYILQNSEGKPLDLDSLNGRVITPALKADTSGNPLNASGHLGHADLGTTMQHYTKPQRGSINAALEAFKCWQ
jgi:integrase